jgi:F0F1-type ATP synthase membrane subunit b/b'
MPQTDTITYLSQLFWTFTVFIVFYAMMVKHILPAISTSIKARKKKLNCLI